MFIVRWILYRIEIFLNLAHWFSWWLLFFKISYSLCSITRMKILWFMSNQRKLYLFIFISCLIRIFWINFSSILILNPIIFPSCKKGFPIKILTKMRCIFSFWSINLNIIHLPLILNRWRFLNNFFLYRQFLRYQFRK